MLLTFNPLWSISEPPVVVVWKSLELWVHFCCTSPVDWQGPCCGETWNELWDPIMSGNPWILTGLGFHSGSSEGTFLYGKPSAEFGGLSWALPQNWTRSLLQSLPIYTYFFHVISLCCAWSSLNSTGESPASLSLWRLLYCHLSGLRFGVITVKALETANKKKVKIVLQFKNLVQPQICCASLQLTQTTFCRKRAEDWKKPLRMLTRINNRLRWRGGVAQRGFSRDRFCFLLAP